MNTEASGEKRAASKEPEKVTHVRVEIVGKQHPWRGYCGRIERQPNGKFLIHDVLGQHKLEVQLEAMNHRCFAGPEQLRLVDDPQLLLRIDAQHEAEPAPERPRKYRLAESTKRRRNVFLRLNDREHEQLMAEFESHRGEVSLNQYLLERLGLASRQESQPGRPRGRLLGYTSLDA